MKREQSVDIKETKLLRAGIVVCILIIVVWIASYFLFRFLPESDKEYYIDLSTIVNSLFSGFAIAGIVLTILLQRNELALQRQELKETREELKRAATAQEKSEQALKRQAENLKISAKLSALNTLVGYYSNMEMNIRNGIEVQGGSLQEVIQKRNMCVAKIEQILEEKEA